MGDMSLVAPRPLPLRDVGRFDKGWLMRRFSMRPGLTCLWQIRGRSTLGSAEWVQLDLRYFDQWSFVLGSACYLRWHQNTCILSETQRTRSTARAAERRARSIHGERKMIANPSPIGANPP